MVSVDVLFFFNYISPVLSFFFARHFTVVIFFPSYRFTRHPSFFLIRYLAFQVFFLFLLFNLRGFFLGSFFFFFNPLLTILVDFPPSGFFFFFFIGGWVFYPDRSMVAMHGCQSSRYNRRIFWGRDLGSHGIFFFSKIFLFLFFFFFFFDWGLDILSSSWYGRYARMLKLKIYSIPVYPLFSISFQSSSARYPKFSILAYYSFPTLKTFTSPWAARIKEDQPILSRDLGEKKIKLLSVNTSQKRPHRSFNITIKLNQTIVYHNMITGNTQVPNQETRLTMISQIHM